MQVRKPALQVWIEDSDLGRDLLPARCNAVLTDDAKIAMQELYYGQITGALAVRERERFKDRPIRLHLGFEFKEQSRLSNAGFRDDRNDLACPRMSACSRTSKRLVFFRATDKF